MTRFSQSVCFAGSWVVISLCSGLVINELNAAPDYAKQIQPILTKYCGGCHNEEEANGELSLSSFDTLQKGGEHGAALVAGDAKASRLIQMITGKTEPVMPPEDEPKPNETEIHRLMEWINAGAIGPTGSAFKPVLTTPKLNPSLAPKPITALAYAPDGSILAIARFQSVELRSTEDNALIGVLKDHPGKINSLEFTHDRSKLIVASGVSGLRGEVKIWDLTTQKLVRELSGHRDVVFCAKTNPDDTLLATSSYDKQIILWELKTGRKLRSFPGHNGAVFDLDFSPNGQVLASASADSTVKVWSVEKGIRLDTLSQPLKEQYSVAISADGKSLFACGEDNRIRKWNLISYDKAVINPIQIARFGHEQAVEKLELTTDGKYVVTVSADRVLKIWDADALTELAAFDAQPDSTQAMAIDAQRGRIAVGRMDGSLHFYDLPEDLKSPGLVQNKKSLTGVANADAVSEEAIFADTEPNNNTNESQLIRLPAKIEGTIHGQDRADVDLFRFSAAAGQQWIFEVQAAQDKSPLDSHIAIYDLSGNPVPRVFMQAIRDSYFTFRGKDSKQTGDFRLHNWQEMKLNQYLYAAGEVVKLYHYPRGPDSGFNVYPNFGHRHTFFDTTAVTHALGEPCYIVEPRSPGTTIVPNGLPVFQINFENDDEGSRSLGSDSRLTFTAPNDGEYVLAIRDVRGFQGEDFRYTFVGRIPKPDFSVSISGKNPKVALGAGKKFGITLNRIDGFDGEVQVSIDGLPDGFSVTTPITVESGHLRADGAILAEKDAKAPTDEQSKQVIITAHAEINGETVSKKIGSLGEIQVADAAKVVTTITPDESSEKTILDVVPGQTITATLSVSRNGHDQLINYGKESALFNSPHGVFVDNTGLNGVEIRPKENKRTIFITAESWVQPCERSVFVQASVSEQPTSTPILLRVVEPSTVRVNTQINKK